MSNTVPSGWSLQPLSALANYYNGRAFKPEDWSTEGLPIIRIAQITNENADLDYYAGDDVSDKNRIQNGDLLFSWSATLTALIWNRGDAVLNQHIFKVEEKEAVDRSFLHQTILNSIEPLADYSHGSTMKHIKKGVLDEYMVLAPPLPEQQKIAAILSSVDDVIGKTRAQIDKLKDLKTGILQELLTKGIGHTEFKDSPVGRIPAEWTFGLIGNLFEIQLGKMLSRAAKVGISPRPYLGNKNVQWGKVDLTGLETMDFSDRERKKFLLKPGDLLMCEGGEVGRSAIWEGELKECYYQKAIHRLRPIAEAYEPRLLLEYMRYAKAMNLLIEFISQTSIAHLTREKLAAIPVPVPPKAEQRKIVEVISSLDSRINLHLDKLQSINNVKKALMQDLLTGNVRVKLDSNEPTAASIQAAKAIKEQLYDHA